jgi:hypothetical protein
MRSPSAHTTCLIRERQLCALHFPSNVRNLLPGDFPVFGHAIHHPRWRDQDHEPVLEPHPSSLFRADPARIRRGIDGGDKLLAVIRVRTGIAAVFRLWPPGTSWRQSIIMTAMRPPPMTIRPMPWSSYGEGLGFPTSSRAIARTNRQVPSIVSMVDPRVVRLTRLAQCGDRPNGQAFQDSRIRLAITGNDADHYGQVSHGRTPVCGIGRGASFVNLSLRATEG